MPHRDYYRETRVFATNSFHYFTKRKKGKKIEKEKKNYSGVHVTRIRIPHIVNRVGIKRVRGTDAAEKRSCTQGHCLLHIESEP